MDEKKVNFYMMVGVPGSGKSTWAESHKEEYNFNILSSDALRVELFGDINCQSDNAQVFYVLRKRTLEKLKAGRNVCYDATNVSRKNRRGILSCINQECKNVRKIAVVFATPYDVCIKRDANRDRTVSSSVITKFVHQFEFPCLGEGFDEIVIVNCDESNQYSYFEAYEAMTGFDQKNSHHSLDLKSHCEKCQDYILEKNNVFDVEPELAMAALLHDYGKLFTASWDKDKNCNHYYNHENVGAYVLLTEVRFPLWIDKSKLIFYVNYHMVPYKLDKMSDKKKKIYLDVFYKDKFMWDSLMLLHEGDEYAH